MSNRKEVQMSENLKVQVATRVHYAAAIGALFAIFVPLLNIALPLCVLAFSDTDEFAKKHGWQAIKFQLFMLLYLVIACALFFFAVVVFGTAPVFKEASVFVMLSAGLVSLIAIIAPIPLYVFGFIMPIIMAGRAGAGQACVYPLTFSKPWQV